MHAASPLLSLIMSLFSVILPTKMWFSPTQPITIRIDSKTATSLILTKFDGTVVGTKDAPTGDATADLRTLYPELGKVGTYVLFAVPKGKGVDAFEGTPIVIEALAEKHQEDVSVVRIEPLRYVEMQTDAGKMTMCFYYDTAPNTVDSFLRLSSQGYYDGLTFHRIMPNFMLQGGDPKGDGGGGPGYSVNAEFNDRKHEVGVLSMARQGDPNEQTGAMPGPDAANSAGSQFFICLDYNTTKQLDGRYTVFGKVVDGTETMDKLKATPLKPDPRGGEPQTPVTPPVIQKAEVFPVKPGHNPYASLGLGVVPK
jgi:cyclophilin family peptidyl-prolyl cis-trans isomerase